MEALLPVANVLGRLLMFFSLAYVLPIACSIAFRDGIAGDFAVAMLLNFGIGLLLTFITRRHYRELKIRDGFLLVALSWLMTTGMATIPLMIVYADMSYTDAFFEMASAITTTGATVMVGLDYAPQSINLWRHELQWLGGMGLIVLAVAILPLLGVGGMQLFRAETPGPMKESRLTARIADTAKALWFVYLALTLACMLSLRMVGMNWFDALCHAFSAVSLGGFSTRDASIGAWDSPAIEGVLAAFMVLAGINFATHYTAWRRRSIRTYAFDAEARTYLAVLLAGCLVISGYLHLHGVYPEFLTSVRHVTFNLVSMATSSGYASVDFDQWPIFASFSILLMSSFTACSGSTGGGIKMVRTLILYKQARRELHKLLHPNLADLIKLGHLVVPNKAAFSVLGFIFLYLATMLAATFLLLASGMDFVSAFSAAISCINNAGPGLGEVGPARNFSTLNDFETWVCAVTMLLGRLEILSVAVIFTRHFWRK